MLLTFILWLGHCLYNDRFSALQEFWIKLSILYHWLNQKFFESVKNTYFYNKKEKYNKTHTQSTHTQFFLGQSVRGGEAYSDSKREKLIKQGLLQPNFCLFQANLLACSLLMTSILLYITMQVFVTSSLDQETFKKQVKWKVN